MRKRAVANVMKKNCNQNSSFLFFCYLNFFFRKSFHRHHRKMHRSHGMLKARVKRPGMNQTRESKLPYPLQAQKIWMIDYLQNERIRNGDETVNGIVEEYLFLIHGAKIEDSPLSELFTFFNNQISAFIPRTHP